MASTLCKGATAAFIPAASCSCTCMAILHDLQAVGIPRCSFQSLSLSSSSSLSTSNEPPSPSGSWRWRSGSRSSRSSRMGSRGNLCSAAAAQEAASEDNDSFSSSNIRNSGSNGEAGGGGESGGAFEMEVAAEEVLRGDQSGKVLESLVGRVLKDDDKESEALLKDFAAAAERVAKAKEALNSFDKRGGDMEDILSQIMSAVQEESRVPSLEVSQRTRDVLEAEEELKAAEVSLVTARAGGSLDSLSGTFSKWEHGAFIDEKKERAESLKAMVVADVSGTLAGLPFVLSGKDLGIEALVTIGGIFCSCSLFGVAYRYMLRRDLGNIPMKFGATVAFSLVRAFGEVDAAIQYHLTNTTLANVIDSDVMAATNITAGFFSFGFAALALDYCFRENIVSPFPIKKL